MRELLKSKYYPIYLLWDSEKWDVYDESTVPDLENVPIGSYHKYMVLSERIGVVFDALYKTKKKYNKKKYKPTKSGSRSFFPTLNNLL